MFFWGGVTQDRPRANFLKTRVSWHMNDPVFVKNENVFNTFYD